MEKSGLAAEKNGWRKYCIPLVSPGRIDECRGSKIPSRGHLTHRFEDDDPRFRSLMLEHQSMVFSTKAQGDPLLSRRLQQLVSSLPEMARTILVLRYQEDMSPDEIGGTLDMPVATVKSQLQRTLRLLREKSARALH